LVIDPTKWNEKLRTALPVLNETIVNPDEEDRVLNANNPNKSRIKKKEERTGGKEEEDEWLFHRKPVKKVCYHNFLTQRAKSLDRMKKFRKKKKLLRKK
jgi:hypothetical protein